MGKAWRTSLTRAKLASLTRPTESPVSLSVFSLVPDLFFDCPRVLEHATVRLREGAERPFEIFHIARLFLGVSVIAKYLVKCKVRQINLQVRLCCILPFVLIGSVCSLNFIAQSESFINKCKVIVYIFSYPFYCFLKY